MAFKDAFTDILVFLNINMWYVAFAFLIGFGLYFTFKLKGLQILKLRQECILSLTGVSEGDSKDTVSSFESFCIGLGARVGVGNIAGVASAIVAGGPGAVFWMWVFAIIGAATSFVESVLAQIFKERKADGQFYGGPAYYVSKGLGSHRLAVVISILGVVTFGFGFMGVQASYAVDALTNAFTFDYNILFFAGAITLTMAYIIIGGIKRIGVFSTKAVPVMALAWIAFASLIILYHYNHIIDAFSMIFSYAFTWQSAAGGLLGSVIMNGLRRGVFSNEAGLGSMANIASTADIKHPVEQGMIQSFGTLVNSLVVCTFTALALLCTYGSYEAILETGLTKASLVQAMVDITLDGNLGSIIVSIFLLVFAFTSLIGYYTMSETNLRFVSDRKESVSAIRIMVLLVVFLSPFIGANMMELMCDVVIAPLAIVNMVCILLLGKFVYQAYDDWNRQLESGVKEPVFSRDVLDDPSGVTEWK